jgi:hypothetical protein
MDERYVPDVSESYMVYGKEMRLVERDGGWLSDGL